MKNFTKVALLLCSAMIANSSVEAQSLQATDDMKSAMFQPAKGEPVKRAETRKTRAGKRWYGIVESRDTSMVEDGGTSMYTSSHLYSNLLWQDSTMRARFTGTGGVSSLSAVWLQQWCQTFDPTAKTFNRPDINVGLMGITSGDSYTIDSFAMNYVYNRVANKPNIVDTMVISLTYGAASGGPHDIGLIYWNTGAVPTNFGVDTVKCVVGRRSYTTSGIQGANVQTYRIPLTAATANDTNTSGFNVLQIPVNLNVPAGMVVGASVMFRSGDLWTANVDTIQAFNHIRLYSFEEVTDAFPGYTKGDYNCSHIVTKDTVGNWGATWKPTPAFSNTYRFEHHWWYFH
ncbi:MAG: hypothetical protein RL660_300, partial [Bacteroidota bacterium]